MHRFAAVFTLALLAIAPSALAQRATRAIGVSPIATTAEGGQRWALVIGINDYINVPDLKFARQDAEALAKVLIDKAGFPSDNVMVMTDQAPGRSPRFPTRGNLYARISQFAATAGKNDVLMIVFSGHGVNIDGQGYLVPIDGAMGEVGSLLSLNWVKTTIETSAARQRLLILDSCHSGARGRQGASLNALSGAAFMTLASCESSQLSHEDPQTGHGVFTAALMSGLTGAADTEAEGNRDGVITADELFHYASVRTRRWGITTGLTQTPVREGRGTGRVELVRYSRIDTQTIAPPPPVWRPTSPTSPVTPPRPSGPSKIGDTITNSIGMKLTYIPAGEFLMGSPRNEEDRDSDETQHRVRITKPFMMGVTEVTQGQWQAVMGTTITQQRDKANRQWPLRGEGDGYPMYYVSWDEAAAFCRKLSQKEGKTYRLPTEAEWEYACRAGTTTRYSFGDSDSALGSYGWYRSNSDSKTHPVGQKKANAWGLYDMHGNVWEWCSDWYGAYPSGSVTDPTGASSGTLRVLRGGSWGYDPGLCRSANRNRLTPVFRSFTNGFRVLLDLSE